jgi:DNA-directed RNA polymerase subunit B"
VLNREILSRAYFTRDKIVRHHIDSFNDFLDYGMQKVISEQGVIETDIEDTYVKLGEIRVGKPLVKEADGAQDMLYPNDARLRDITYSAPIYLEMTIIQGDIEHEPVETIVGQLPIMLMSKGCKWSLRNVTVTGSRLPRCSVNAGDTGRWPWSNVVVKPSLK